MATVMNMSNYEVLADESYGEEVMCAGWNPQLALVSLFESKQVVGETRMPRSLAEVDVDAFLKMMYACQR